MHYLRNELALTGAHIGCETSQCGACTVLMDGQAVKSCTILAVQADGAAVTTIEGLAPVGDVASRAACISGTSMVCSAGSARPGMVLSTVALLADDPDPSEESIRHGLEGNICRCTGYHNIVRSVQTAAKSLAAGATPEPLLSRDPAQRGSAMNPSEFAYQRASSVDEAIALLQEHGEGRQADCRRPQPAAHHEAASRGARNAGRHRAHTPSCAACGVTTARSRSAR